MPITVQHRPKGVARHLAAAAYKAGAAPWWRRLSDIGIKAAELYGGRERRREDVERQIQGQKELELLRLGGRMDIEERREGAALERMGEGARLGDIRAEEAFGRQKELIDYGGEQQVAQMGRMAEAARTERRKRIAHDRMKVEEAMSQGMITEDEGAMELERLARADAGMPAERKPPTPEEIFQKTSYRDPATGALMTYNEQRGSWTYHKIDQAAAPLKSWGEGRPNRDIVDAAMNDVQNALEKQKTAAEEGWKPPSPEQQHQMLVEAYNWRVRAYTGEEPPAGPGAPVIGAEEAADWMGRTFEGEPGGLEGVGMPPGGPPMGEAAIPAVGALGMAARGIQVAGGAAPTPGAMPEAQEPAAGTPGPNVDVTDFSTGKKYRVPSGMLTAKLSQEDAQAVTETLQQRGVSGEEAQQALFEYSAHQARMEKFQSEDDQPALEREIAEWRKYRRKVFGF